MAIRRSGGIVMYVAAMQNSKIFTLDMIKTSCKTRFKEGQKIKIIFANDRSDHSKQVNATIIKFYPLFVKVKLSEYETRGMTYIDFAKAARKGMKNAPINNKKKRHCF